MTTLADMTDRELLREASNFLLVLDDDRPLDVSLKCDWLTALLEEINGRCKEKGHAA